MVALHAVIDVPGLPGRVGGDRVVPDTDELVAVLGEHDRAAGAGRVERHAFLVDERPERALRPAGEDGVAGGRAGAAVGRGGEHVIPAVAVDDVAALEAGARDLGGRPGDRHAVV